MFGAHNSVAGGLENALLEAERLGMDCVQIFTANQRQWRPKPPDPPQIEAFHGRQRQTGVGPVVSHDSYLINLASPKPAVREKSVALFRAELQRCEALGIPFVVTHPGSHVGGGEEEGLRRVVRAIDRLHRDLPGLAVRTCLETTAGQGTNLGAPFEHLRRILDDVAEPDRLAVCLDTCHMLAAGYDLTSADGAEQVLDQLDAVIGLDRVEVIHVNDSKGERGSRLDRHTHLGHGHVDLDALGVLLRRFPDKPKILETPKKDDPETGRPWDAINLDTARKLMRH
jgi:deoxyribonuclease-4